MPIFEAIERIAAPCVSYSCWCSKTIRTARSRTSSEYLAPVGFFTLLAFSILQISRYSQDPKSPTFPGRFTLGGPHEYADCLHGVPHDVLGLGVGVRLLVKQLDAGHLLAALGHLDAVSDKDA